MNYTECLRYLEDVQNLGIKFGLENVLEVLSDFGHPEQSYPSVLVGGTNGKGSVCGMLNRILKLQGFRAGMFTSPHLVDVEERIRIGEALIPRRSFSRLLTRVREKVEALIAQKRLLTPPTYFEHMCCLAFLYFAQEEVDIALLEVGMGGRFDATNVVVPKVSVITTISPEHQKYLGETPAQIAFEKAGIIRPGVPVVCGVEDEEAYEVLRSKAREVGAPFFGVLKEHGELRSQKTPDGFVFTF
ncbi:MAG: bifunctional folylpolyglutamate synthase/dihydrofolate synthase, partial [Candidatus Aminicenantales bacterium]